MRLVPRSIMDFYPTSLYLAFGTGLGGPEILPPVSRRCCDSKELEINLGYNNFFCGPRPTTRINQISSFRASALAPRFFLLSHSRRRLGALAFAGMPPAPHVRQCDVLPLVLSRRNTCRERYAYLTTLRAARVPLSKDNARESVFSKIILGRYLSNELESEISYPNHSRDTLWRRGAKFSVICLWRIDAWLIFMKRNAWTSRRNQTNEQLKLNWS